MQLAGTGAGDHRVGRVDRPDGVELRRRRSKRRTGQAIPAPAPGGDDAGCRVGPGRGARLSTSPFPRTALRTRRAGHPGTGLSTRPVTNKRLRRRSAPQYPARTTRSDAGIHRRLLPCRHATAAPLCPFAMCTPLACSDSYGHSATTRHQQPTTCLPTTRRREGGDGSLPTFTTTRSTRSVSSYTPAASPGVRRSPSPWPPHRPLPTGSGVARRNPRRACTADRPRSARFGAGTSLTEPHTLVPRVHLLV
jgi:hypothetical protein